MLSSQFLKSYSVLLLIDMISICVEVHLSISSIYFSQEYHTLKFLVLEQLAHLSNFFYLFHFIQINLMKFDYTNLISRESGKFLVETVTTVKAMKPSVNSLSRNSIERCFR
ncbi:hypothetical protein ACH5RR_012598 [Cinchona calisaya]|uniref:Uncharacterized protein n=1 Tax=Cinchona calisaya TaxID=153742 RepID=A0ABD3ABT3_9GENT